MNVNIEDLRKEAMGQAQGALILNTAYIGVTNGLFVTLAKLGSATTAQLAEAANRDPGYVVRWCDAAYAFQFLDETQPGVFTLTEKGDAFRPDVPGTLAPFALQSILSAHMAERAAGLMPSGERPGEKVLAERATVLPWFGPMLELNFGPLFENQVLPNVPAYEEVDKRGGLAVDLGCGNGWYLRRLAQRFHNMRGVGLDGFEENIRQAAEKAEEEHLSDRLQFKAGDIHQFTIDEPVDLIAMNRALHHVWDEKENVFQILRQHLKPGGVAVIWEPNWPADREKLRERTMRPMAYQNMMEHIQGNHFLRPDEVADQFRSVDMEPQIFLLADGREAVITGTRKS